MAVPDVPARIEAGRLLGGRYRLVQRIARGGMAEVWEGYDEVLSRPVAVKALHGYLAEDGVFLERFRREAVTAARLAHPGVVSTFDTGFDDGTAYIVMELVRGQTLRQLLNEQGRLQPWLAVAISRQVADTLVYAHQVGLVHRDIKPANILLTDDEWGGLRVKVTDFGIAKASTGFAGDLTRTGTVLGTPKYLSPEQIRGEEPDARADLYAEGVVLFEMLTGTPPFVGSNDMTTALAHINNPPPRPSSRCREVPAPLDRLVADLLVKDPQRRVPSAVALRQRLDAINLDTSADTPTGNRKMGRRQRDATRALGTVPAGPAGTASTRTASTTSIASPTAVLAGEDRSTSRSGSTTPPSGNGQTGLRAGPAGDGRAPEPPRRPLPRRMRTPGLIVLALVVVAAVVAGLLLRGGGRHHTADGSSGSSGATTAVRIIGVTPFMVNGRPPDNPQALVNTFDGNPATYWSSDEYRDATFGNLYPGMGLAIELSDPATVHHLAVSSPTNGWSAQTFVATDPVPSGRPVSAWGTATDTHTAIPGAATFSLGGHHGRWVLLWLTRLGSSGSFFQVRINQLTVS